MRRCVRRPRARTRAFGPSRAFSFSPYPQPHNANPESSWRRIANVSFPSAARCTFKPLRAPGRPIRYPRVPQGCGSIRGYGDENCLVASPLSSECSLVRQWRFWTSIRNFPGARKGFEEVLSWERPGRAIGRAASFWFPRRPTPATHGRAGASRPGPPKDEVRRFQRCQDSWEKPDHNREMFSGRV